MAYEVGELDDTRSENTLDDIQPLAAPSVLPEPEETPIHLEEINNLAGDTELCEKVRAWVAKQIERYKTQEERIAFCEGKTGELSTMDVADRMERIALNRDTSSKQHSDTRSNVTSSIFHRSVKTVTAAENMLFYQGDELPAEYEPEVNTSEYSRDQGEQIAVFQTALEQFTFDEDKRYPKLKHERFLNNKYGLTMLSIEWVRKYCQKRERVPDESKGVDDRGMPRGYKFSDVTRLVADWPSLSIIPIEDAFFDAAILDLNVQRCYGFRGQITYEDVLADAQAGAIMNADKIQVSMFYQGDDELTREQRSTNSGEETTLEKNGLLMRWKIRANLPIKEKTYKKKPNGKGEWTDKVVPTRYFATFIGDISKNSAVCIALHKNPYNHGKVPETFVHSHDDDKPSVYSDGYATRTQALYWQDCTSMNFANDNLTAINWSPWILNGPCKTKDLTFRAGHNKVITLGRGVDFKQVQVQDATGITLPMRDRVDSEMEKIMDADKPIQGESAFARTSATESRQNLDMALVPLDNKASFIADQIFTWMFEMDAELWRQYGNPDITLNLTYKKQPMEINPTLLWGPIRTKVTAIARHRNDIVFRQMLNSFIQNAYPMAQQEMNATSRKKFWKDAFVRMGFENADEYFPMVGNFETQEAANRAAHSMLFQSEWVEPQPQEDHRTWISIFEPILAEHATLPKENQNPEGVQMMRQNIEIRRQIIDQEENQAQAAQQQVQSNQPNAATETGLPGEIAGDQIEAQEGAMAG